MNSNTKSKKRNTISNNMTEIARTNFLLMKLLYINYVKQTSKPLSEVEYYEQLNDEFRTIYNGNQKIAT